MLQRKVQKYKREARRKMNYMREVIDHRNILFGKGLYYSIIDQSCCILRIAIWKMFLLLPVGWQSTLVKVV